METNSQFVDFRPYRENEEILGTGETQNSRYRNPRPRVFLYVTDSDPLWNWILMGLCVIGIALDPLFFYTPVIDDNKKVLGLDKKLGIVAIALRSFFDALHLFYIILELRPHSFAPFFIYQRVNSNDYPQGTARKYLMLPIDLLSILPLPQVVILTVIRGSTLPNVMNLLKVFVIVQNVPRIARMYPFFTKARSKSAKLAETTWVKAPFNLLLYMLASHVFGALWYFLAIEKETACWKTACVDYFGCGHGSFNFDDNLGDYKFLHEFCSPKTQNAITYDFGIYGYALETGIVNARNFLPKFLLCFRWGLQNLSCFGQNLQTSSSVEENVFAIVITIFGLVLFLFLIGNMQIYLQSKTVRSEEMRLKAREIEQWMSFRKLSGKLQEQVKKYQQYVWRETKGIDVENLLNNLPKDLRRNIMRELCLDLLKKVPMFEKLDEQHLDTMCDRLKPVFYSEESYIIREGDPVDQMLIIMRGKLLTRQGIVRTHYLKYSDFLGEEVFLWALNPQSSVSYLPISTTTVKALTEVEAFALMADDLKFVASQLRRINSAQLVHTYKFYSNQWRNWAACFIQASWRSYGKKKREESQRAEEKRLQNSWAEAAGVSPNFGATIYATRFAANVVRTRRRNSKAKKAEGETATLLQKPPEPEFSSENQE